MQPEVAVQAYAVAMAAWVQPEVAVQGHGAATVAEKMEEGTIPNEEM